MQFLPIIVLHNVALQLEIIDIIRLCLSSKRFHEKIYSNKYFWKCFVWSKYPIGHEMNWLDIRNKFIKYEKIKKNFDFSVDIQEIEKNLPGQSSYIYIGIEPKIDNNICAKLTLLHKKYYSDPFGLSFYGKYKNYFYKISYSKQEQMFTNGCLLTGYLQKGLSDDAFKEEFIYLFFNIGTSFSQSDIVYYKFDDYFVKIKNILVENYEFFQLIGVEDDDGFFGPYILFNKDIYINKITYQNIFNYFIKRDILKTRERENFYIGVYYGLAFAVYFKDPDILIYVFSQVDEARINIMINNIRNSIEEMII